MDRPFWATFLMHEWKKCGSIFQQQTQKCCCCSSLDSLGESCGTVIACFSTTSVLRSFTALNVWVYPHISQQQVDTMWWEILHSGVRLYLSLELIINSRVKSISSKRWQVSEMASPSWLRPATAAWKTVVPWKSLRWICRFSMFNRCCTTSLCLFFKAQIRPVLLYPLQDSFEAWRASFTQECLFVQKT